MASLSARLAFAIPAEGAVLWVAAQIGVFWPVVTIDAIIAAVTAVVIGIPMIIVRRMSRRTQFAWKGPAMTPLSTAAGRPQVTATSTARCGTTTGGTS